MGAQSSALLSEEIEEISRQTNLTELEVKRLYKRFQKLDRAQSGTLDPNELVMVPEFAMNPLHPRLVALFENVNFHQFVHNMSAFSASTPQQKKLDFTFRIYDVDADGFISKQDLETVLRMLVGNHLTDDVIAKVVHGVIRDADLDGDGKISRHEFQGAVDVPSLAERLIVRL